MEYDERRVGSIRLKEFKDANNRWARFVAANRVETSSDIWGEYDNNRDFRYDIVSGPTADGSIMDEVLSRIENGELKISDVKRTMFAPPDDPAWGTQISFHTSKAIALLKIKSVRYFSYD